MYTPLCIIQCLLNFMTMTIHSKRWRSVPFVKKLYHPFEVAPDVELWALAGGVSMLLLLILGSGKAGGCDPRRWPVAHHQRFGKNRFSKR